MSLVCITTFTDTIAANIAAGMLEEHGIRSILDGSVILDVLPIPSSIGGVRMLVRAEDAQEASGLLREHGDMD